MAPARRVVIPVHGSDREFLAQEQAVLYADALGVPLVGVKVSRAPDEEDPIIFDYIARQAKRRGIDFEPLVLMGTDPVSTFLSEIDALDLVIVGSERAGDRHHVGGFVERLLHSAPGSVQVVRLGQFDEDGPQAVRAAAYTETDIEVEAGALTAV